MPSGAYVPIKRHIFALESALLAYTARTPGSSGPDEAAETSRMLRGIVSGSMEKMKEDGNEFVLRRLLSQKERDRLEEEAQLREEAEEFVGKLVAPFKRRKVAPPASSERDDSKESLSVRAEPDGSRSPRRLPESSP